MFGIFPNFTEWLLFTLSYLFDTVIGWSPPFLMRPLRELRISTHLMKVNEDMEEVLCSADPDSHKYSMKMLHFLRRFLIEPYKVLLDPRVNMCSNNNDKDLAHFIVNWAQSKCLEEQVPSFYSLLLIIRGIGYCFNEDGIDGVLRFITEVDGFDYVDEEGWGDKLEMFILKKYPNVWFRHFCLFDNNHGELRMEAKRYYENKYLNAA